MKRTHGVLGRIVLAFSLGAAAASAHAVPIIVDFTGTVSEVYLFDFVNNSTTLDPSSVGQVVTGRIIIETDGLVPSSRVRPSGTAFSYSDAIADPSELITSELTIGGVSYDPGLHAGDGGAISGIDSSGTSPDLIGIWDTTTQHWLQDGAVPPPGEYASRTLNLTWHDAGQSPDFFEWNGDFEPLDLIPLVTGLMPAGYFSQLTSECADGVCAGTFATETYFAVNSLTIHTPGQSVPEPGTLALLGVGLLGGALARRSAVEAR